MIHVYINIEEKKCVHQLISITHDIYKAFDADPSLEVRGVFLDLSKAFDKVWDDGLLYELRRMGICERYFEPIHSFLSDGFQRVLLNGQNSKWSQIIAGVPQCSVLGPLLFLVYIYDSPYIVYIYDSIFSVVCDSSSLSLSLNENLSKISLWRCKWEMLVNSDTSKQAQEIKLTQKNPSNHNGIYFNNAVKQKKYSKISRSKFRC